jgi:serine/threonine-protein kinase
VTLPDDANQTDDERMFAALDGYVAALQAGDAGRCARWLDEFPQWRNMAQCLEALDSFAAGKRIAPPNRVSVPIPDSGMAVTIVSPAAPTETAAEDAVPPATDFGKYELLEEIGRGGMGVVFRARQRDLDRIVALKMILSSRLAAVDDVRRFYREARAAGSLRHPHIVGIHEVGEINGQHYFAMDFIAGSNLAASTRHGPVDPERAARCLAGVAHAVQFLHDHGIVHRDLKPSNILLDAAGAPYVTDFGLAKVFDDNDDRTQTGVILGTPGYMSPEQAAGRVADISSRSDIYSLGAILYELLTGRPPFREENQLNTILQVLEGEPTLPRQLNGRVPSELERICLKCLDKAPERRYASATALANDLDRYLRGEPVEARPAGLVSRVRRWIRREPGLAARLAIMAVVMGIVELTYLLEEGPFPRQPRVRIAFTAWAALAFALQWLLRRDQSAWVARVAWSVTDPIMLLIVLVIAGSVAPGGAAPHPIGTLLIGYPLLITASGLWFRVRLVAISTVACVISYVLLVLRTHDETTPWHYPLIFLAALCLVGFMTGFQVHRVRTLNRYFEQSPPA